MHRQSRTADAATAAADGGDRSGASIVTTVDGFGGDAVRCAEGGEVERRRGVTRSLRRRKGTAELAQVGVVLEKGRTEVGNALRSVPTSRGGSGGDGRGGCAVVEGEEGSEGGAGGGVVWREVGR